MKSRQEKSFLYSGEIHYFRIPPNLWKIHLKKLREAGADTVSTYIPWGLHESEEGRIILEGGENERTDLARFLDLASEEGLRAIVKPGPYILAEYAYQGLPRWLPVKYPSIVARRANGSLRQPYVVSYLHPDFISAALRWYDRVMPFLARRQESEGGNIILMQICNEVGLNHWLSAGGDYSPATITAYHRFLEESFRDIDRLNRRYGTDYQNFNEVAAPEGSAGSPGRALAYLDWHRFFGAHYRDYLGLLVAAARKRGITVPLFHNLPGWVGGRADPVLLNLSMYLPLRELARDIFIAPDHIPENPSYRNSHHSYICNQAVRSFNSPESPLFVAEMQAGTRERRVRTYPDEMGLFYRAALAEGVEGVNFYMFSQGRNFSGEGHFGPDFYWETPLAVTGDKQPLYPVIQQLGDWIKCNGTKLLHTELRRPICLGYYAPYYLTQFTHPLLSRGCLLNREQLGWRFDPEALRESWLFEGPGRALRLLNSPYAVREIQTSSPDRLRSHPALWIGPGDWMDRATSEKLWDYASSGGDLLMMPALPELDGELRRDDFWAKKLEVTEITSVSPSEPKITIRGVKEAAILSPILTFALSRKAEVIARTTEGDVCGFRRQVGRGRITVLGCLPDPVSDEYREIYRRLLPEDPNGTVSLSGDHSGITFSRREGNEGDYLFLLNYLGESRQLRVEFPSSILKRKVVFPRTGFLRIPPRTGRILNLDHRFPGSDCALIYSTREIIGFSAREGAFEFALLSPPLSGEPTGEMAFFIPHSVPRVELNSREIPFTHKNNHLIINSPLPNTRNRVKLFIDWESNLI